MNQREGYSNVNQCSFKIESFSFGGYVPKKMEYIHL